MKKRIIALAGVLVMLVSLLASCGGAGSAPAKEFSKAGMTITLTNAFTEKDMVTMTAYYESQLVIVTSLKEEYEAYGISEDDFTLDEYADMVIEANNVSADVVTEDDLTYFRYDKDVNGKNASYLAFVYKTSDAFWLVQFGCDQKNYDKFVEQFKKWAKSVKFT